MNIDERNGRSRTYSRFMANIHIAMGCFFLFIGGLTLYKKSFGNMTLEPSQVYGLSALVILYGIFRLWRGIRDIRMNRRGE